MELTYKGKKSPSQILETTKPAHIGAGNISPDGKRRMLIRGDNLGIMQSLLREHGLRGKVDLVYIDPPFATNTVFRHNEERTAHISSSDSDAVAYSDTLLGAEYLEFIRERLIFLRELMSKRASIYLHIDGKIGHYVKLIMDEVFGSEKLRNDITRIKCNPKNFSRRAYGNIKDLVLFYTKSDDYIWNEPKHLRAEDEVKRLFNMVDANGRHYTTNPLHAPGETRNGDTGRMWKGMLPPKGRHWRYDPKVLDELDAKGLIVWSSTGNPRKIVYADEMPFKKLQDIWEFKDPPRPSYPTEKNLEMLRTIVATSSTEDSIVLDCFAGSGTTLVAADQLNWSWIGIDRSEIAIKTALGRLKGRVEPAQASLFTPANDDILYLAA
jgi:adenine-specific DNA-methyltransferase